MLKASSKSVTEDQNGSTRRLINLHAALSLLARITCPFWEDTTSVAMSRVVSSQDSASSQRGLSLLLQHSLDLPDRYFWLVLFLWILTLSPFALILVYAFRRRVSPPKQHLA